ncbi:galactose-3-O-sulfotransferase 4 isoform X2 [Myripristis murdjan]|uniref:galactose-3-O-sulfotransferase 4 isoform X2 n=1 Tax=Myripristis murdjan TaxID=586833 RepID=UPI001175F7EA|nr:galactose-3-O-sulfotransferase 4-like isoform X2 [Myripristis murdjan]
MTFRWLATQFWRYRMAVLLLTLGVTSLLILLGTHSLQDSSYYVRQKGRSKMPTERREGLSDDASERPNNNPSQEHRGSDSHVNGYNMQMTRKISPPVAFLKTHKTGSSTVQNLLFRMGEREGATFAFPYYTYQFSYPDKFRAEFVDELPDGASQFDIICSHMRLDLGQLKQAAEAAENKSALSLFLESPESYWDPKEHGNGLGKNPMSFDLGLNSQQWNSSWPADLTLLEETFQLVMIAEHFDESLVLLGALLKLQPEELAYVRLNARSTQDVTQLDDKIKARIRSWNNLDVVLYDFFVQLFWEKAEQYGLKRLKMEVARLRASTERIRQGCVAREGVPPGELEDLVRPWQTDTVTILGYQVQGNLTQQELGFCVRLVLPELQYHAHLYFQQYGRDMRAVPTD